MINVRFQKYKICTNKLVSNKSINGGKSINSKMAKMIDKKKEKCTNKI